MELNVDDCAQNSNYKCCTEPAAANEDNGDIVKHLLDQKTVVENSTPLIVAAEKGNLGLVKLLIDRDFDVSCGNDYEKPLIIAAKKNNLEMVKLLLEKGANVNYKNKCGTPLSIASEIGSLEMVKLLISCGADVNLEIVKPLSDYCADVNSKHNLEKISRSVNQEGDRFRIVFHPGTEENFRDSCYTATAIVIAVHTGHLEIVHLLLDHGADANSRDNFGEPLLFIAVRKGNLEMTRFLLTSGADINSRGQFNETALFVAVEEDHFEIVRLLIDHGINVNYRNSPMRPLSTAVQQGNLQIIKLLLDRSAHVTSRSDLDFPFSIAVCEGSLEVVQLLLGHGADVNLKNEINRLRMPPPLFGATRRGHLEIMKLLLDHDADVNFTYQSSTPLQIAILKQNVPMVRILLDYGADVNYTDGHFKPSSLMFAANMGNLEIVHLVLDNGADFNSSLALSSELPDFSFTYSAIELLSKHLLVQNPNAKKPEFAGSEDGSNCWDQCKTQIDKMIKQKMGLSNITFYKFLVSDDENKLANWVRNQHVKQEIWNCDYEREFPLFADEIKAQNQKGLSRKRLLDVGCEIIAKFPSWPKTELSKAISLNILQGLENQDLQNLDEAQNFYFFP